MRSSRLGWSVVAAIWIAVAVLTATGSEAAGSETVTYRSLDRMIAAYATDARLAARASPHSRAH